MWAQMGTIGVEATMAVRDRLNASRPDVLFLDAPVSGSKGAAEQGQLLILASGPALRPTRSARCSRRSAARRCGWVMPARAAR